MPPVRTPIIRTITVLAAGTLLIAGCGGDDQTTSEEPTTAAPEASSFPAADGTLEQIFSEAAPGDDIVVSPATSELIEGRNRFGFGVFSVDGEQIGDADVAIYAAHGPHGEVLGPFPARIESLATEPEFVAETTAESDAKVVYVADVPFKHTGEWRLAAAIDTADGLVATYVNPSVIVKDDTEIPNVGEPAPEMHTPTLAEVGGDVESIDTRQPPSSMHGDDLADVLGEKPVVLLFATPALCLSRVCGPVVDVAEQVKAEYGDDVAFIHQEIWIDNEPGGPQNLRPQVKEYGLFTEPWLFVIDENGEVATRIEGAFSVDELESALEPLV